MPARIIKALDFVAEVCYSVGIIKETDHMQTIEPNTQETILNLLPDDYLTAIDLMCQLLANMMLSGNGIPLTVINDKLKAHLAAYEGT